MIYDRLEPVGERYSAGIVAATVANFAGKVLPKGAASVTPEQAAGIYKTDVEKQEELSAKIKRAFGGLRTPNFKH